MKTQVTSAPAQVHSTEREIMKYTLFKVDSQWRRLDEKRVEKQRSQPVHDG